MRRTTRIVLGCIGGAALAAAIGVGAWLGWRSLYFPRVLELHGRAEAVVAGSDYVYVVQSSQVDPRCRDRCEVTRRLSFVPRPSGRSTLLATRVRDDVKIFQGWVIFADCAVVFGAPVGSVEKRTLYEPPTPGSACTGTATSISSLYVSDPGATAIMKVTLGGESSRVIELAQVPGTFAVDDAAVYYVDDKSSRLMKVPFGGTPITLSTEEPYSGEVALDEENVYWIVRKPPYHWHVRRVPKSGGPSVVVCEESDGVFDLTRVGGALFYLRGISGHPDATIQVVRTNGGPSRTVPTRGSLVRFGVQGSHVFFANFDGLYRATL